MLGSRVIVRTWANVRAHSVAASLGVAVCMLAAAPVVPATELDPGYLAILRRYGAGERPQAISDLGAWSPADARKQVAVVEDLKAQAERCPTCLDPLAAVPLRAGAMLHADRDRVERPLPSGREQAPRCPGPHAAIAERYAALLARDPDGRDFARRFFLATSHLFQLEACFEDALARARAGLALFPRDALLRLAAGSVLEERAVLVERGPQGVALRLDWLKHARRELTEAVSADPDLGLARVRLGRVLWELRQPEAAQEALEAALARPLEPRDRYLAHLFLGRVHEDAQRLAPALAEYRRAVAADPEAQTGAVALSHALLLAGESEESRHALEGGLDAARRARDPYWDYLVANAREIDALVESLYSEVLE
jgi:predicted Zn-dependent protease